MLQSTHQSTHTHMAPVNGQCKEHRECSCPRTLERHGVHQAVDIGLFHAEGTRPWLGNGLLLGEWKRSPQPTTKQNNWGVNARFSAMQLQSSLAGYVGRKRCQRRQNLHAVKPPEGPFINRISWYILNLVLHFLSGVLIGMHVWKKQSHRTNRNRLCNYFHKRNISPFFGEGARTLLHGKEMKKWTCLDKDHTSSWPPRIYGDAFQNVRYSFASRHLPKPAAQNRSPAIQFWKEARWIFRGEDFPQLLLDPLFLQDFTFCVDFLPCIWT